LDARSGGYYRNLDYLLVYLALRRLTPFKRLARWVLSRVKRQWKLLSVHGVVVSIAFTRHMKTSFSIQACKISRVAGSRNPLYGVEYFDCPLLIAAPKWHFRLIILSTPHVYLHLF
jgi:hypothetical protein